MTSRQPISASALLPKEGRPAYPPLASDLDAILGIGLSELEREAAARTRAARAGSTCAPRPGRLAVPGRLAAAARLCRAGLARWLSRARSRRELLKLGPIELADIGLTRTDIQAEGSKWPLVDLGIVPRLGVPSRRAPLERCPIDASEHED